MKDNITSREDIFLAKIAGKDVDIKTMTPPVVASMREKLMLDIAERIDNIEAGSGGGSAMVVNLTPTETEGVLTADTDTSDIIKAFEKNIPVYINTGAMAAYVFYAFDGMAQACMAVPANIGDGRVLKSIGLGLFQSASQREWHYTIFEASVNDVFTIHYTVDPQTGSVTSTETAGEAFAAAERGATIVAKSKSGDTHMWSMALRLSRTSDGAYIAYCNALAGEQPAVIRLDAASADEVFTGSLPT